MIKKILTTLLFTSIISAQFSAVTTFTGPAGSSQHAYVGQSDLSGAYSIITGMTPVPSPVYGIFTPAGANLQTAALVSPFETGAKYACDVDGDGIEDILYGDSIVLGLTPLTLNWIKNLGGTSGPIIRSWVIPNPIAGILTISSPAEILLEGYNPGDVFAYGSSMNLFSGAAYLMLSYVTQAGGFTDLSPFAQPIGVPIITVIRLQKSAGLVVNAVGTPVGGITFNYVFNFISAAPGLVAVVAHTVPTDNITDFAIGDFSGDGWDDIAVLVKRVPPAYDVYLHTMVTGMYAIAGTTLISRPGAGPGLQASKIVLSSSSVVGPISKDISIISSTVAGALNPVVESTNNLFTTVTTTTLAPGTAMGPLQAVTKPSRYPNQEDIFVTAGTLHWLLEPTPPAGVPMSISNYGTEPIQGAAQGLPYIGNSNFGFAMNGGIPGMPTMLGIGAVQYMPPIFVPPALNLYTNPVIWAPATTVNAYGWAGTNYAIPNNPALIGTTLYSQWFTANGLGQAVGSQGMTTIIY